MRQNDCAWEMPCCQSETIDAANHSYPSMIFASAISLSSMTSQRGKQEAGLNTLTQDALLSFLAILSRDSTLAFEPDAGMQSSLNGFTDAEWHPA